MSRKRLWELAAAVALLITAVVVGGSILSWRMHRQRVNRQLSDALHRRDTAAVREALREGASVHIISKDGHTPLLHAVWQNDVQLARDLLQRGARVDARDSSNATPLIYAAWLGRREIVQELIRAGADVNARDGRGNTPLFLAEHRETARALKQASAKLR